MKLSNFIFALAALSITQSAFAGILQLEDSAKQVSGVTISKGGKMVVEGRSTNLVTVAAGVRTRFSLFPVYVGELLVNDSRKYVCQSGKALESLKDLNGIAVRLTMLRAIGMSDLQKAFTDGFDNNDVDANSPAIKKFIDAVAKGGDIPNNSVLGFTGEKLADGEAVTYENATGKAVTVKGGAGFVSSIFSLWLGNPGSDGGLKSLRDKFTTCQIQ
jgi:hypothetical protein